MTDCNSACKFWYACGQYEEFLREIFRIHRDGGSIESDKVEFMKIMTDASKRTVGPLRCSRRELIVNEKYQLRIENNHRACICKHLRADIEDRLGKLLIGFIDVARWIGSSASSGQEKAGSLKLMADHFRYYSEISKEGVDLKMIDQLYTEAADEVMKNRTASQDDITHLELGIALNHSIYCYEILHEPERAIRIAREAFLRVMMPSSLTTTTPACATRTIQRLRDNISLWISVEG